MKPMGKKYRRKSAELRARQGTLRLIPESTHVHASKVMLKILQAKLQKYVNRELPDVQAGFRKAEEPEIKVPTSVGSSIKQESSRKTSTLVLKFYWFSM